MRTGSTMNKSSNNYSFQKSRNGYSHVPADWATVRNPEVASRKTAIPLMLDILDFHIDLNTERGSIGNVQQCECCE